MSTKLFNIARIINEDTWDDLADRWGGISTWHLRQVVAGNRKSPLMDIVDEYVSESLGVHRRIIENLIEGNQ